MNRFANAFLGIVLFLLFTTGVILIMSGMQFYRFWVQDAGEGAQTVLFEVEAGSSLSDIAQDLETQNIIASAFWFKVYTVVGGYTKAIQAGSFALTPGEDYATIAGLLRDAEANEVSLTIPEGYTIAQIGEVVTERFEISQDAWDRAVGVSSSVARESSFASQVKPTDVDLEGYLFPDTYRFFIDATAEDIVSTLSGTMSENVSEAYESVGMEWTDADLSVHEMLTLASIIQREVQNPDEMSMVADIFLKRLSIGMPLQADSTVNYITGNDTPAISLEDRDIDSLYNTYKYAGLPPGPISNPGFDAIIAVLNPTPNNYYYFLTTDEGEVIYAVTHDEHVRNKAIYHY